MRKTIALVCIVLALALPVQAATADGLQEKVVAPIGTTAMEGIAPILQSIMASNMTPDQKERSVQALIELAKYDVDSKAKVKESIAAKIFDLSVKLISLAAAIFATVKVTT